MVRTSKALMVGAALAVAGTIASATPTQARYAHRILHVMRLAGPPAHLRVGYVGAAGFAGGPPGPVVPSLVDFPSSGFFSPAGFIAYDTGILTGVVTGVPGFVVGSVGVAPEITGAALGAGLGIIGTGVAVGTAPLH